MALVSGTNYSIEVIDNKNVIINGNFDVWQRGTSFAAIADAAFSADRFSYEKSGTMVHTIAQSTDVPTYAQSGTKSNYSLHADVTTIDSSIAAGDYCMMVYTLEGYDYARIAGGDATLSFWVKAAKAGIHCVSFRNSSVDRSYVAEYTVVAADTWEEVTLTIPLTETGGTWDYINGVGLRIDFTLTAGTTFHTTADAWQTGNYLSTSSQVNEVDNVANNFHIAQVQLERGNIATSFEVKNFSGELAKCQRYYERRDYITSQPIATGQAFNTTFATYPFSFSEKRGTPTFAVSAAAHFLSGNTTVTSFTGNFISDIGCRLDVTSSGLTATALVFVQSNNASAYVNIDAEL